MTTPDLGLPLLAASQVQPEVTINETLMLLSALQNGVIAIGQNAPPGSPTVGDSYVVGTAPTGSWAGKANKFATFTSGGWRFLPDVTAAGTNITMGARHAGMRVWRRGNADVPATKGEMWVWDGSAWVTAA